MTILRAMVIFPRETNLPADATTNTWHFNTDGSDDEGAAADVATRLDSFYNGANVFQSVGKYLSREIVGANVRLKVYKLSDPEPRTPIYDELMPVTEGTAGDALPSEVAVCLSYHLAPASGLPQARRRGRIFLGPLSSQAQAFISGECYVSSDIITDATTAAARLRNADTADLKWSVYSPTNNTALAPIAGGWIDNAFDIQRRRGVSPTSRTTWT